MALAYDEGRLTRDVDALFEPAPEVRRAVEAIAEAHGLEPDWLNDAATLFNVLGYTRVQQGLDSLTSTYPSAGCCPATATSSKKSPSVPPLAAKPRLPSRARRSGGHRTRLDGG